MGGILVGGGRKLTSADIVRKEIELVEESNPAGAKHNLVMPEVTMADEQTPPVISKADGRGATTHLDHLQKA